MLSTGRGTHLKVHSCFCTHGRNTGTGTLELKQVTQLQHWKNIRNGDGEWVNSSDEEVTDDTCGYKLGTLKCYYSTVHTIKAERLSMRPLLRNNTALR